MQTMHFKFTRHQKENPGQKPLDLLGFRHSVFDTYYRCYRKTTQIAMFPGSRKKTKVSDEVKFDKLSHLIGKAKQRQCAECGKATLDFCEKCMLLYTQNVLRNSMNSDRFTE